jgi:hypothetical protein
MSRSERSFSLNKERKSSQPTNSHLTKREEDGSSVQGCRWPEGSRYMTWMLPTHGGERGSGSPNDPAPRRVRRPTTFI